MATGASNADLAVILIDARQGVLTQTRRHSFIASLLGIRHVVLAVNKIDLVDFSEARFDEIRDDYAQAVARISAFASLTAIPLSARFGDNVIARSAAHALVRRAEPAGPSGDGRRRCRRRRCSRSACRCSGSTGRTCDFRGYAGTIAAGSVRPGDRVTVAGVGPQLARSRASSPWTAISTAPAPGSAVTLTLADEIDISRGDVLAAPGAPVAVADQFDAHLVWLTDQTLFPGRSYLFKLGTRTVSGSDHAHPPPHRREHLRAGAGRDARRERRGRDRRLADRAGGDRAVRRQPRTRRLHRDRPADQRHRRRRHDRGDHARLHQHRLARSGGGQAGARGAEGAAAGGAVVHRPVRRRQIDHRQPGRAQAARARPPHLYPRRRQRAPRPQPRSRASPRPTASRTSAAPPRRRG